MRAKLHKQFVEKKKKVTRESAKFFVFGESDEIVRLECREFSF